MDIKYIRDNQEVVRNAILNKQAKVNLDELLALDERRRKILEEKEGMQAEQNRKSKGPQTPEDLIELKGLKERIRVIEDEFKTVEIEYKKLLSLIPNVPTSDTPVGPDASGNVVIRKWGKLPSFNFQPKEHSELGEALGIIDIARAGKVSGTRFGYIMGQLALMQFAIINLVLKTVTNEGLLKKIAKKSGLITTPKPFIPVIPPVFIKPDSYQRMARLEPKDERYYIPSDDIYLIGSAEHTLGALHMDETFTESDLPMRYIGYSTAFRREAGSYGKDTKGILRVHQFDKLEFESFTSAEDSLIEQDFIVSIQEYLLQQLGLPYQVVMVCTGDMGGPDARQIDIETWMPGQNMYRETHTSDMNTDYQSRRLQTKVKRSNGQTELVHMNDATAFAIGRILIAIMENYQTDTGTIIVPKVLRKHMGGLREIKG